MIPTHGVREPGPTTGFLVAAGIQHLHALALTIQGQSQPYLLPSPPTPLPHASCQAWALPLLHPQGRIRLELCVELTLGRQETEELPQFMLGGLQLFDDNVTVQGPGLLQGPLKELLQVVLGYLQQTL